MKKVILALVVAMTSMSAFAADYRVSATSDLGYRSTSVGEAGQSVINLNTEVAKIMGNFEFGLGLDFSNTSSDPEATTDDMDFGASAVVGYYLDPANITNSIFGRFRIGLSDFTADEADTANPESNLMTWTIIAGKNIKLSDSVSWSPFVSYGSTATDPETTSVLSIVPVSLSIYL